MRRRERGARADNETEEKVVGGGAGELKEERGGRRRG